VLHVKYKRENLSEKNTAASAGSGKSYRAFDKGGSEFRTEIEAMIVQ
jgi:hypothetical protein